jgi:D-serine deaminase-like pyridoxal phosphate-dependent protein
VLCGRFQHCEATDGSLSVAATAVSSEKVAVVDSGKVGRSLALGHCLGVRPH